MTLINYSIPPLKIKYGIKAISLITLLCGVSLFILYKHVNVPPTSEPSKIRIPNIVHYIIFGSKISFITFVSITSVIKIHKPDLIMVHSDSADAWISSLRWRRLGSLAANANVILQIKKMAEPTHVFGHHLSSVYHASDVARLTVLLKYGGIYLDTDVIVLRQLQDMLDAECIIGLQDKDYVGSQVIMAIPGSRLIKHWLEAYKWYKPWSWYEEAGRTPITIAKQFPFIVTLVPDILGVHNLLTKLHGSANWTGWRDLYSIHMLVRHSEEASASNEDNIKNLKTPFGDICRWILYSVPPVLSPFEGWDFSSIPLNTENHSF